MTLGINEILNGIEYSAVNKITASLIKQGFKVETNHLIANDNIDTFFDIYAEKGDDKRVYELKIGKNKIQKKQFVLLQEQAKKIGAKLFVVYLELPQSKNIQFEGIEKLIFEDLISNFPSELDELSTHTTIDEVYDVDIDSIIISNDVIKMEGSGTISIDLQFGSKTDLLNNDGMEDYSSADFFYKLNIDINTNRIIHRYYKIDLG